MSFAEWKKNNKVMAQYIPDGYRAMAYLVAQAAYKAGERQGRKDAEEIAKRAIELRALLDNKDAERYRFLRDLNGLELRSTYQTWTRHDGSKFNSSHYLAGNDTAFSAYETLDETIDAAMKVKK